MIYTIINVDDASELKIYSGTDSTEDVLRISAINKDGDYFNEVEHSIDLAEAIQLRDCLTTLIETSKLK